MDDGRMFAISVVPFITRTEFESTKRLKSAPALASCSDPPSYLTLKPGWEVPANIAVGIIRHRITATTDFIIQLLRKNIFTERLPASMCSRRRNEYGSKGKAVT